MNQIIRVAGDVAAIAGVLVCGLSGAMRVAGAYQVMGFGTMALFNVGIGFMVLACLLKIHLLTRP